MKDEKVILSINKGLIDIKAEGVDVSGLLSMLVNAITVTILDHSTVNTRDELDNCIIKLLKGEQIDLFNE